MGKKSKSNPAKTSAQSIRTAANKKRRAEKRAIKKPKREKCALANCTRERDKHGQYCGYHFIMEKK